MLLAVALAANAGADEYAAVRAKLETCAACHGPSGASTQPQYPILAGQQLYYLYVQLKDYKSGFRKNPIMGPLAATLETKEEMMAVAKYFSEQKWPDPVRPATPADARAHDRLNDTGGCMSCHLTRYEGNSRVPRLAGQHFEYLKNTMADFKSRVRGNMPDMSSLLETYSEADLTATAAYLASLKP
jgi:cytochrome c553